LKGKDEDLSLMYLRQEVFAASREKLLLLTYEIAIKACKKAISAIDSGNAEESNKELKTAQKAVRELRFSLRTDDDDADDFTDAIGSLYDFMYIELVDANLKKDTEKIGQVIALLTDLLSVWREALEKLRSDGNLSMEEKRKFSPPELVGGGLNISC